MTRVLAIGRVKGDYLELTVPYDLSQPNRDYIDLLLADEEVEQVHVRRVDDLERFADEGDPYPEPLED